MRYPAHRVIDRPAEQVIAVARVSLAAFAVLAMSLDPPAPPHTAALAYWILLGYLSVSVVLLVVASRRNGHPDLQYLTHALDLCAAASLIYLTEGPTSPFFVFFTFLLISATLRWNWRGALITAGLLVAVFAAMASGLVTRSGQLDDTNRIVVRGGFLLVAGAMLTYFGAHRERSRARFAKLAAWPAPDPARREASYTETGLSHVVALTSAKAAVVVWTSSEAGAEVTAWPGTPQPDAGVSLAATPLVEPADFRGRVTAAPAAAKGHASADQRPVLSAELLKQFPMQECVTAPFLLPNCEGRVFLLDPPVSGDDEAALAELIATRIGVDLQQEVIRRSLEAAAALSERSRLARDLHDGLLQTLTAANLHLRLAQQSAPAELRRGLELVRQTLVAEQLRVRSFVEGSRELGAVATLQDAPTNLSAYVKQIGALWGCKVEFDGDIEALDGSPRQARHLTLLLAEAVSNAAHHGGARQVTVTIQQRSAALALMITDDGCGFADLKGRYTSVELEAAGAGPRSLQARVGELGGDLQLETGPHGATLRVELPDA